MRGAQRHSLLAYFPAPDGRHHEHERAARRSADSLEYLETVRLGQRDVQQHHIGVQLADGLQCAAPVLRDAHNAAPVNSGQRKLQQIGKISVVVHNENTNIRHTDPCLCEWWCEYGVYIICYRSLIQLSLPMLSY